AGRLPRRPLSLARGDDHPGRPGGLGDLRGRRRDGRPASGTAGGRRPVPSGIGSDSDRPGPRPQLPRGGFVMQTMLAQLLDGHDLTRDEAREAMNTIMSGEATPAQIGGFLVALRLKGETADEIAGCAEAMREHVLAVKPQRDDLVDTAG